MEVARLEAEMDKEGNTLWFPIFKKAFDTEFEIQIDPSEDSINKGIMVQQLNSVLGTLTNAGVPITDLKDVLQEIYDTMGLPGEKLVEKIGATPMINTAVDQGALPEANMPMPGNMTPTNQMMG
jgi:hypothetical protein